MLHRQQVMEMFLSDSDCESFSESSSSEDLDDIDSMYGGQAQNILSNLDRSIGKIDDFLAFERGFIHGDIVALESDPSGQLGRVVDVDMVVDLETVYGELIKDVNCKNLRRIRSLVSGDYVVLGPWLGRVNKVVDSVTILFDDGAKCEVTAVNPENLIPVSPSIIEDAQYPYYPGQRVHIRRLSVFKSARWLCGSWKENRDEGTVCQVEAGLVYVDWVASAMVDSGSTLHAPSSPQDSRNITLLSCFPYANWQLGDWCMVQFDDEKVVIDDFSNSMHVEEQKKFGRLQQKNNRSKFDGIYVILRTKSKVDVLWQDGTHSIGLDSQSLTPANNVGDHEFWPEQFVLEKTTSDDPHISSGQRFGIVKRMDAKERTVKVKWEIQVPNPKIDMDRKDNEEIVSAYELIEYPDYTYCLGDVVFRFQNAHSVQADGFQECNGCISTEVGAGFPCQTGEDLHSRSKTSGACCGYPNDGYLSCIGNVIGFKDGHILVRWAGGLTSKVKPSEIFGIDKCEDLAATTVRHDDAGDNLTAEEITNDSDEADNNNIHESTSLALHQAAIGFFTNVAVSLFGFLGSTYKSSPMNTSHFGGLGEVYNPHSYGSPSEDADGLTHGKEVMMESCNVINEVPVSDADDLHNSNEKNVDREVQESQDNKDESFSSICESPGQFKQFDMVGDCLDHHFVSGSGKGPMLSQVKRGWLKKVQQEWSMLEKNLPETIYVRVNEERIDLLRAAIVGAPGTPYHDGLFFFDFFIPPNYPNEPPLVHYHSGGLRLNPNLYESGRVCLSLLKTWTGTGTEVWNPESSTILQVLLSLQALVLNEKPYFNEAGYDNQIGGAEGEKNSITYNENAFILSCKSMLYHLHKPLKNFEALVDEHFRHSAQSILLACKAYMDGAPVGCAFSSGMTNPEDQKSSSMGFKIMVAKLLPKLVSEFTNKGIDCSKFLESKD